MIRLFDSLYLTFDWTMDSSRPQQSLLFSEKSGLSTFIQDVFNPAAFFEFLAKDVSFRSALDSRYEGKHTAFWLDTTMQADRSPLTIFADENSFSELLVSFYKVIYPNVSAESAFRIYSVSLDKLEFCDNIEMRPGFRKSFAEFESLFEKTVAEPAPASLIEKSPIECLIGNYLACGKSEESLQLLKPAVLNMARQFLWSREVMNSRANMRYGFFDLNQVASAPDLKKPSIADYVASHPELEFDFRNRTAPAENLENFDFSGYAEKDFRKKVKQLRYSEPEEVTNLANACLSMDAEKIISADMNSKWGSPLLYDNENQRQNNYLLVGYFYACARNKQDSLLTDYQIKSSPEPLA